MQAAYSRFARVSLAALDNKVMMIPPDPEVEADIVTSDPAAHDAVKEELRKVCNQMARAYQEQSTQDNSFFERMDEIKHQVKLKLVTLHGLQRYCHTRIMQSCASTVGVLSLHEKAMLNSALACS